jgi:hypothetical protein
MEPIDFAFCASDIGSLMGCFGTQSLVQSLIKTWRKSAFRSSFPEELEGKKWSRTETLTHLGMGQAWERFSQEADQCKTQEHISNLQTRACDVFVVPITTNSHNLIQSLPLEDQAILAHTHLHCANHSLCLRALAERYTMNAQVKDFVDLLIAAEKVCYMLTKSAHRAYGRHGEERVREMYNRLHAEPIQAVGREFKKIMPPTACATWSLEGRIDGMCGSQLIEIKHRTNKIPSILPEYELMQVHIYMFLLDQQNAIVLQCAQALNSTYVQEKRVEFCAELWDRIVKRLAMCMEFIAMLCTHAFTRNCFCALDEQQRLRMVEKFFQ